MVLESNRPATGMSTNGVRPWRGRRVRPPSFGWPVASRASNGATRLGVNGRGGGRRGPSRAVELRALNLQQHCAEKSVREPIGRHGRAGPGTEPVTLYPRPRGGHAGADGASTPGGTGRRGRSSRPAVGSAVCTSWPASPSTWDFVERAVSSIGCGAPPVGLWRHRGIGCSIQAVATARNACPTLGLWPIVMSIWPSALVVTQKRFPPDLPSRR